MKLIYVLILLIVLIVLVSLLSPKLIKEKYENKEELVLKSLIMCGRNLVFPYYGETRLIASQRAELDITLQSQPQGKCFLVKNYNPTFAIIQEDGIFYKLKKSCMMLPFKHLPSNKAPFMINNSGETVSINILLENQNDIENVSRFILSNPLYIEFNVNSNLTVGYRLTNTSTFTNNIVPGNNKLFTLTFQIMSSDCDRAFDYEESQTPITETMLIIALQQNQINIQVYYLDTLPCSFQNIGLSLPLSRIQGNTVNIFTPNYNNLLETLHVYEFMKTFTIMHSNRMFPVLTYNFTMVVDKSTQEILEKSTEGKTIFKCAMGDNNFVQVLLEHNKNEEFTITASTCDDTNCKLSVTLPYFPWNTISSVFVTIGLTEIIMYIKWLDKGKKFIYSRKSICLTNNPCETITKDQLANINNLSRLFMTKKTIPLTNIGLVWDNEFVSDVLGVSFGYKNLNKQF